MLVIGPMELLVAQLEKSYCHPEEAWKKKAGENQQRIGQSQLSAGEDDERSRSERCRRAAQQAHAADAMCRNTTCYGSFCSLQERPSAVRAGLV